MTIPSERSLTTVFIEDKVYPHLSEETRARLLRATYSGVFEGPDYSVRYVGVRVKLSELEAGYKKLAEALEEAARKYHILGRAMAPVRIDLSVRGSEAPEAALLQYVAITADSAIRFDLEKPRRNFT